MKKRAPQIESIHRSLIQFIKPPTHFPLHLIYLGGRENYKFGHLDKTKDLSATPAGKLKPRSRSRLLVSTLRERSLYPAKPNPLTYTPTYRAYRAYFFPRTQPPARPQPPSLQRPSWHRKHSTPDHNHHIVCILSDADVFLDKPNHDTYIRMRLRSVAYLSLVARGLRPL
jgi:hypothetical protein